MTNQKNISELSKRKRRTGNLAQSYQAQMKQFLVNCNQRKLPAGKRRSKNV